jgi:hypothetical protein
VSEIPEKKPRRVRVRADLGEIHGWVLVEMVVSVRPGSGRGGMVVATKNIENEPSWVGQLDGRAQGPWKWVKEKCILDEWLANMVAGNASLIAI